MFRNLKYFRYFQFTQFIYIEWSALADDSRPSQISLHFLLTEMMTDHRSTVWIYLTQLEKKESRQTNAVTIFSRVFHSSPPPSRKMIKIWSIFEGTATFWFNPLGRDVICEHPQSAIIYLYKNIFAKLTV